MALFCPLITKPQWLFIGRWLLAQCELQLDTVNQLRNFNLHITQLTKTLTLGGAESSGNLLANLTPTSSIWLLHSQKHGQNSAHERQSE